MDYKIVEDLIKTMSSSDLSTLELQSDEFTIRMSKGSIGFKDNSAEAKETALVPAPKTEIVKQAAETAAAPAATAAVVTAAATAAPEVAEPVKTAPAVTGGNLVASPMVGTFYSSASPDKPAYVSVGSSVQKGSVLCIVEAMKLMNEIESEFAGEVVEILVKNGDMVEYGQPLFRIK
jgi:acetyl-CoA carboxylase biotin carboxyl carrier protein